MKKATLVLSALALSIGLAMGPVSSAISAETASSSSQQLPSLAPMLEKVMPSVVSINVEGSTQVSNAGAGGVPPQFQQFFGDDSPFCQDGSPFQGSPMCQGEQGGKGGSPGKQDFRALGSGVIIDAAKGYVVTNNHVVDNATKISVKLSDGRSYEAKVIGKDPRTDIALLQLKDFKNLTAIKIADSDKLRVGDYTVAIGNPYGLGETVTSGIVSALGRSGLNVENYENFIQTDAAINSGNSGGALVNLNGQLIGINTAIIAPGGGNVGIGFAIPANMVANLIDQLRQYGEVKRGVLGVTGGELTPDLAEAFGHKTKHGAFINQVMPGSSAEKAGLKAGDIIVAINGKNIKSFAELRATIATTGAGHDVKVDVIRNSERKTFTVRLMESDAQSIAAEALHPRLEGATFSDSADGGIRVDQVDPRSAAAQAGLLAGDQIVGANNQPLTNLKQLRQLLAEKPRVLALNVLRDGQSFYLILR